MQILLIILALAIVILLMLFLHQKSIHKKELADISDTIAAIMAGEDIVSLSELEETLVSKIHYQLMRLKNVNDNCSFKIKSERDNTQKIITEIAHQLRTPLLNIRTYAHMLEDSRLTAKKSSSYVNAIISSEEKLSFLVESLIKMSRFENHLIQIKPSSDNLSQTVLDSITQVYSKAMKKNIEITMIQSATIRFPHDPNWLGEALYNILDNSIKYSPQNSKVIVTLEQNDMLTKIIVRDFGNGIAKGEESQIFSRYYRRKNVGAEEGYGIGLYLSREIVSRHSGVMKVQRETPGLSMIIYLEDT